jgi:hypothetical protein
MTHAFGLAVSGTEVRLAHLVSHKGQLRIESLERAKLKTTLEYQLQGSDNANAPLPDAKDAFGGKDSHSERETRENSYKQDNANVEILYKLLEACPEKGQDRFQHTAFHDELRAAEWRFWRRGADQGRAFR